MPTIQVPKALHDLGRIPPEEEVDLSQLLGWLAITVSGPLLDGVASLTRDAAEASSPQFAALLALEETIREAGDHLLVAAETVNEVYPPVPTNEGEPF